MSDLKPDLEVQRFELEKKKAYLDRGVDFFKWTVAGCVAIGAFVLIDLSQEKRATRESDARLALENGEYQRTLFEGYITAKDVDDLLLWKRKLDLIDAFVPEENERLNRFVIAENGRIDGLIASRKKREMSEITIARLEQENEADQRRIEVLTDAGQAEPEEIENLKNEVAEHFERIRQESMASEIERIVLERAGVAAPQEDGVETITRRIAPGVDLSGEDLREADLTAAPLRGANLSHATLDWGTLHSADLSEVDLAGASLRGVDLRYANLAGVKNWDQCIIDHANVHGVVNEPEGFLLWAYENGALMDMSNEIWNEHRNKNLARALEAGDHETVSQEARAPSSAIQAEASELPAS